MNIKIFIAKKHKPRKKLKKINLLLRFLNTDKYSLVNNISTNKGITPATFLKTAS